MLWHFLNKDDDQDEKKGDAQEEVNARFRAIDHQTLVPTLSQMTLGSKKPKDPNIQIYNYAQKFE